MPFFVFLLAVLFSHHLELAHHALQYVWVSLTCRPLSQKSSKLLRVSDLFVLGYSTIYESINILHYLEQEGYGEGGLCKCKLDMRL